MSKFKIDPRKLTTILNIFIILGLLLMLIGFGPILYDNIIYYYRITFNKSYTIDTNISQPKSVFSNILPLKSELSLVPANRSFSIVIEKLGISVPIVPNVSVTSYDKYMNALKNGVAHAITSDFPSSYAGNTYLFAHSGFDIRYLSKFSRAFNLIDKLEIGDTINIVYDNQNYEYIVKESIILPGFNTEPLTRDVVSPILTLQSCYPPGTTLNRIVVTSELKSVTQLK